MNRITGVLVFLFYTLWARGNYQEDITKPALHSSDTLNQIFLSGVVRSIASVGLGCFVANLYKILKEKNISQIGNTICLKFFSLCIALV